MTLTPPRPGDSGRFAFVDALRGLAALAVTGFHFYVALSAGRTRAVFGQPFDWLLDHGNAGVEVFFVLSGFVIAHSLRHARVTPSFFGRFLLRRSIRLDPPYWATIVLAIGVGLVANVVKNGAGPPMPSAGQLGLHLFYLQGIAGSTHVVEVFWTLCLEVQFYLSFVLLLWGAQRLSGNGAARPGVLLACFLPLTLLSLAVQLEWVPLPWPGTMFKYWYLFALGVVASQALNRAVPRAWFWLYFAVLAALITYQQDVRSLVGALTGLSLFVLGERGWIRWVGDVRSLQYLGRVSYSLYLVHFVVGCPVVYFLYQRLGGAEAGMGLRLGLFLLATAVSLGVAELLNRFVEAPSLRLSRSIFLVPKAEPTRVVTPMPAPVERVPAEREPVEAAF